MTEHDDQTSAAPTRVDCPAAMEPSVRMFIAAIFLLAFGLYCAYDAFVATDSHGNPKYSPEESMTSYAFNVVLGVAMPPAGVVLLVWGGVMLRRQLTADQEGIGYAGKSRIAWSQVDKLVMRGKGLLDLHYEDGNQHKVLKLDSFKLRNFPELVALVESKTPDIPVRADK